MGQAVGPLPPFNPNYVEQTLAKFEPWTGAAEPDSYRDFLGTRTRMAFMPPPYMALAGTVEGRHEFPRAGLHDKVEWAGVLNAALEAEGCFVGVELGAGYGPFVLGSALVAQRRGIEDIKLIAVEGASSHIAFMHQYFRDNGLDPDKHELHTAVVGTYDGVARFPKLQDPAVEWGAEALFLDGEAANRTPQLTQEYEELRCISLPTILSNASHADFVHFDIQGTEFDVIQSAQDTLNQKARRLVIGTHGRDIEQRLLHQLHGNGWSLEADKACSFQQTPAGITLLQDGVQVWKNLR